VTLGVALIQPRRITSASHLVFALVACTIAVGLMGGAQGLGDIVGGVR
jgi:hypothetical protein